MRKRRATAPVGSVRTDIHLPVKPFLHRSHQRQSALALRRVEPLRTFPVPGPHGQCVARAGSRDESRMMRASPLRVASLIPTQRRCGQQSKFAHSPLDNCITRSFGDGRGMRTKGLSQNRRGLSQFFRAPSPRWSSRGKMDCPPFRDDFGIGPKEAVPQSHKNSSVRNAGPWARTWSHYQKVVSCCGSDGNRTLGCSFSGQSAPR
jgi:hypothetical protein